MPCANAQPRQQTRRSVIAYYFLLPSLGLGNTTTPRERRALLQPKSKPIIDVSHDYLQVRPDSAPPEQIAVFRFRGTDLIAASSPDFQSDYNAFHLYRLRNGKLRDVTRQELPVRARTNNFLYELPRTGTTIRVFAFDLQAQTRRPAFNLLWRNGRFVKTR